MFYKRRLFAVLASAAFFGSVFFWTSTPVNSMGTLTLSCSASGAIGLFGSPDQSLTNGQTGSSISETGDIPASPAADFVGAANLGNLSKGDGTPVVASFGLRERGNVDCHVSASVSSYTATNLSYNPGSGSVPLAGNTGTELGFVTLGTGAVTAGSGTAPLTGNSSGHTYGSKFLSGTGTLATLNSGTIGAVSTSCDEFASFSAPPSNGGNLTTATNYVEDTVTFSVPTGFQWAPTNNTGSGSFSIAVEFEIYTGT
jgi:hypothetical protein